MKLRKILAGGIHGYVALALFAVMTHAETRVAVAAGDSATAGVESLEQVYAKAKKEGRVVVYMATSAKTEEVVFPAFEKRFPGIRVNHVNTTADQLVARAVAEARGGKIIADVISGTQNYVTQLREQNMLLDMALPEAAVYPASLKGAYWVATDTEYFIAAWNTSRLKKADEPKTFEAFADPKWAKRLIAEPRDFQILLGLAKYKYRSDDKAIEVFKKIAANKPEFFKGHSQLAELLAAGQADVCMTCYAHHIPPIAKKGAPLQIMLSEGVGRIGGTVTIAKGAPHPNAALLWARWLISEEGQTAFAQAGETPAHPKVEPMEKILPEKTYMLTADDTKDFPKYLKLWNEIFQLR
ncbi:MAG: ABC transporter substrate-binding protein [Candidatus Binatia bacterium]